MRSVICCAILLALGLPATAAELKFDFSQTLPQSTPGGFRAAVAGRGEPGEWKVALLDVPPLLPPLSPNAPLVSRQSVLARHGHDLSDNHYPLFVYDEESFGDFTLTTRFKIRSGVTAQMAGIAFRIQDERNYYVVRASALDNTFRFYKVVNGEIGTLIGPKVEIIRDQWYELTVDCQGSQIRCLLDGRELIPTLTDHTFTSGKIAFWTKSDTECYFAEPRLTYTPRVPHAQTLVRGILDKYPRLLGLQIYAATGEPSLPRLIGSHDESLLGQDGGKTEQDIINRGVVYYSKGKKSVAVTLPMRDRNGVPVAAVRVVLDSFLGQTEQNAVARALPIVKEMEARIHSAKDLTQ